MEAGRLAKRLLIDSRRLHPPAESPRVRFIFRARTSAGRIAIQYAAIEQPATGVGRVLLEPGTRRTQPERVSPGIHVARACARARAWAARRPAGSAGNRPRIPRRHRRRRRGRAQRGAAGDMQTKWLELVQQRMQRRVGAHVQDVAAQARLALAPVRAGQGRRVRRALHAAPRRSGA